MISFADGLDDTFFEYTLLRDENFEKSELTDMFLFKASEIQSTDIFVSPVVFYASDLFQLFFLNLSDLNCSLQSFIGSSLWVRMNS